MKPTTLLVLFLFSLSTSVFAQSPNAARAVNSTKKMSKKLDLTDDQFQQVNAAYLTMYQEMDNYKDNTVNRKESSTAKKLEAVKSTFNTTLAGILTPEQLSIWRAEGTAANRKTTKRSSNDNLEEKIRNASTRKTERMAKQLKLNEQQKQQVLTANIAQTTKLMELRSMVSEDPQSIEIERQKITNAYETTISNILNKEQRIKQKEIKRNQQARKEKIKYDQKHSKMLNNSEKITKKADSQTDRIAKRLKLNETQTAAYRSATIEKLRALENLKTTYGQKMSPEKTAASKKIQAEFDKKVKTFLTPEQLDTMNNKGKANPSRH